MSIPNSSLFNTKLFIPLPQTSNDEDIRAQLLKKLLANMPTKTTSELLEQCIKEGLVK